MNLASIRLRCCLVFFAAAAVGCGGGGGGGGDEPADEVLFQWFDTSGGGDLTILAHGGEGLAGDGGDGGEFEIYAYAAGDIRVLPYGRIIAEFPVADVVPDLGENPRTIAADITITPDPATLKIVGDDGVNPATGLWVLPNVTLTLNPNDATFDEARIDFDDGVYVEGRIVTTQVTPQLLQNGFTQTAGLDINATNFVVTTTGVIETHGLAGIDQDGGNGGWIDIYCEGTIVNRGTLLSYGGNGLNGGDGGWVALYSDYGGVVNTGPISAWGGDGATGEGGHGGYADLYSDYAAIINTASIIARGGNGPLGGGDGDSIDLYADYGGAIVNSGNLDASGGNATQDGDGGNASYVYMEAGGSLRVRGDIVARGGNGAGEGNGGDADYIEFYVDDNGYVEGDYAIGGMFIGANLDGRGGNGAHGGDGADIYFFPDQGYAYLPGMQPTILAGYRLIDASGGDGTQHGGDAYQYWNEVYNDGGYHEDYYYVGSITLAVDIDMSGGNGLTGMGGDGASFEVSNYDFQGTPDFLRVVEVTANIDMSGGNGATYGGDGGDFYQYDNFRVHFDGALDSSGGDGGSMPVGEEENPWVGGDGGYIEILSDDVVEVAGTLDNCGGDAVNDYAGDADYIEIMGRSGFAHVEILCEGGDCTNGTGGDGGEVYLGTIDVPMDMAGTTMMVVGGSAPEPGEPGECWINGIKAAQQAGGIIMP